MYACAPHSCSVWRGQKMVSDPLELELQTVMSFQLGAGNRSQVLWKSSQCSLLTLGPPFRFSSSTLKIKTASQKQTLWDPTFPLKLSPIWFWCSQEILWMTLVLLPLSLLLLLPTSPAPSPWLERELRQAGRRGKEGLLCRKPTQWQWKPLRFATDSHKLELGSFPLSKIACAIYMIWNMVKHEFHHPPRWGLALTADCCDY